MYKLNNVSLNKMPISIKAILIFMLGLASGLTFPPVACSWLIFIILTIFIMGMEIRFLKRSFAYGYLILSWRRNFIYRFMV